MYAPQTRPIPPKFRPKLQKRDFKVESKLTYKVIRESNIGYFEKSVQEFIENNQDYKILEETFSILAGDYSVVFKLKNVGTKTTVKS